MCEFAVEYADQAQRDHRAFVKSGASGSHQGCHDSVYGAVLAVALWMTIDLDYPGIGIIGLNNRSLVETLAAMK
jgi:hypothetical protein